MKKILQQPLLWFVVIGVVLFVVDGLSVPARSEIVADQQQRDRLATLWETQTGEKASIEELDALLENWIQEEVLYREALLLGLDAGDSIIRRRLVQKLTFIAESEPGENPSDESLEAFYEENSSNYTLPQRYSFSQLYFENHTAAEEALARIGEGEDPTRLGQSTMLNRSYSYRSALQLNSVFGRGFAEKLALLESDSGWVGPLESAYGIHLIELITISPPERTPLRSIAAQVIADYKRAAQETVRQDYIADLLNDYTIVRDVQ